MTHFCDNIEGRGGEGGCCVFLLSAQEILISVSKWDGTMGGTMEGRGRANSSFIGHLPLLRAEGVTLCEQTAESEGLLKEGKSVLDSYLTPKARKVNKIPEKFFFEPLQVRC